MRSSESSRRCSRRNRQPIKSEAFSARWPPMRHRRAVAFVCTSRLGAASMAFLTFAAVTLCIALRPHRQDDLALLWCSVLYLDMEVLQVAVTDSR